MNQGHPAVSRTNLIATSLISAIPAGFLLYLTLMGVLGGFEKLPVMLMVMMIILLVVALAVVVMPIVIFVKSGRRTPKAAAAGNAKTAAVPSAKADEDVDADFADTTGAQLSASEMDLADDDDEVGDAFEFDDDDEEDSKSSR